MEDTTIGALTRNVDGLALSDLHGDIAVQLPTDSGIAPTVLDCDEYGYGWLGGKQHSSGTPPASVPQHLLRHRDDERSSVTSRRD